MKAIPPDTRTAATGEFAWTEEKIISAMNEFAKQKAEAFGEWLRKNQYWLAASNELWFNAKTRKHMTDSELYNIFNKQP